MTLFLSFCLLVCHVHTLFEDGYEVSHGIPIQVFQHPELIDKEIRQSSTHGNRNVGFACLCDVFLGLLGNFLLSLDLGRRHLGAFQTFNQFDVLQNIALRRAQPV